MDRQNSNSEKHVPTEAEIARLEAEAVAAMQRGEAVPRHEAAFDPGHEADAAGGEGVAGAEAPQAGSTPDRPDFVPYVDDVPRSVSAPEAAEDGDDGDDGEYIPSEMEKRIDAMTPEQWKRWQILGGVAAGIAIVASLFIFGEELSTYGLIVAALLAVVLPRYLEKAWRRKLNTARLAMMITMGVGLAVMFVVIGMRHGFNLRAK
jgi:hypothetical protein